MPTKYDSNALWVALSGFGEGNVFAIYPKILTQLLLNDEAARQEGDTSEAERLLLPSDKEWRLQQYFYLVSLQRGLQEEDPESNQPVEEPTEVWSPWSHVAPIKNPHAPPPVMLKTTPGPAWDIAQVLKAAHLLYKPPLPINFTDEQEMRIVYSLIYDVFRYKSVLDQTLDDVDFFNNYPDLSEHHYVVWLFLMELARRQWGARPRGDDDRANELLRASNPLFAKIESNIWDERVHFAAAIARIRIKNKAFLLSDLLPPHLREERISACVNKDSITGWVNTFKAKKVASLIKKLHELGYTYSSSKQLCAGEYRFDRVCPRFITLRPPENVSIGQTDLVQKGIIVLQEREFCEGASTLCRALKANSLTGTVAQTHASSPRCSAYLAAQLRELAAVFKANTPSAPATPELGRLVVFGAGDRIDSYVEALRDMGIEASEAPQFSAPVCVLREAVHCDAPIVATALDGVVAALATPPNSYSAVTDPIDLVCGRGGDLAMLEILTESEIDVNGKERVQSILEEQKKTLKTLLSKPQIQLILYETHSSLEAENQSQVVRAVSEANRLAREKHSLSRKKHKEKDGHSGGKESILESTTVLDMVRNEGKEPEEFLSNGVKKNSPPTSNRTRPPTGDNVLTKNVDADVVPKLGSNKAKPIPELRVPKEESVPYDPDKDWANIFVPENDLFEIGKLPTLGNGLDINFILDRDGCYLSLIRRKEITRLDAKFMIDVAEERGLFGSSAPAQSARHKRKETATPAPKRRRRQTGGIEVSRISAPTHSSLCRARRDEPAGAEADGAGAGAGAADDDYACAKHAKRQAAAGAASACTCDAKHKPRARRASPEPPRPHSPPCRRPFPLVVHELRLQLLRPHHLLI